MEQLAPYEKVFVSKDFARDDVHGEIPCEDCHGGDPTASDILGSHKGLVRDPTENGAERICGECHPDIAETYKNSLHRNLLPSKLMADARIGFDYRTCNIMDKAREGHCGSCHVTCGQCHVSRPNAVGGGFLDMHKFKATPPMREVCTACHGSRVEKEYFGGNKDTPPDVHWRKRFMSCVECHSADEMHADATGVPNRYSVPEAPKCIQCHESIYEDGAPGAGQHLTHKDKLSCQVCHSVKYKNCYNCHIAMDRFGNQYFENERSELDFKIGLSPLQSPERPERFAVLRHIPVTKDSIEFYAGNGQRDFDALPTWKYATPHNIQKKTPQNESCNACHGNKALFLLEQDVDPVERAANRNVVVPMALVPEKTETISTGQDMGAWPASTGGAK